MPIPAPTAINSPNTLTAVTVNPSVPHSAHLRSPQVTPTVLFPASWRRSSRLRRFCATKMSTENGLFDLLDHPGGHPDRCGSACVSADAKNAPEGVRDPSDRMKILYPFSQIERKRQ